MTSKTAACVLSTARYDAAIFDLDGVDAENLGLEGKPAADLFLEAACRLEASQAVSSGLSNL